MIFGLRRSVILRLIFIHLYIFFDSSVWWNNKYSGRLRQSITSSIAGGFPQNMFVQLINKINNKIKGTIQLKLSVLIMTNINARRYSKTPHDFRISIPNRLKKRSSAEFCFHWITHSNYFEGSLKKGSSISRFPF